jgi:soluble lytic murein transglycosylase
MFKASSVFFAFLIANTAGHDAARDDQQIDVPRRASAVAPRLDPTDHPPLPGHASLFWLVPENAYSRTASRSAGDTPLTRFARGVQLFIEGDYAAALPLVSARDISSTPLADYAKYYTGFTQLRLERLDEAERTFKELAQRKPVGYLSEAVALRRAEVAVAKKDAGDALEILEPLARERTTAPEAVLLQIARTAEDAGKTEKAIGAYRRVYFEFPLSAEAEIAKAELERLEQRTLITPERFQLELGRAERLFGARRYTPARDAFAALARLATGDDRELVSLRLAECDYYLKRHRASRDALRPFLDDAKREAEARFFHLTATRALGDLDTYVALARGLVADFPQESWTQETLNNLASHYIILNEDAEADRVFRELYQRFPQGRHAERAAWKIGWWAYKNGELAETVRIFEEAAAAFPRSDLRPAWLYWAARSRDGHGDRETAVARYRLVATDYLNSYYGRLAAKILADRKQPPVTPVVTSEAASPGTTGIATDALIRELLAIELYDDANRELQYAQRVWGDSPAIQATLAWIRHQQGLVSNSMARFERLRGAINQMKRAYPQYIAAGGEDLPAEMLRVLFPLDYWPLIKKYSQQHDLDPYVIAALMAQESTFTPDIRSAANAYGLMQVIPGTGRRYARMLGIRYSLNTLTQPEANIRIGTAYFRDLIDRFGGAHYALASYNAGENRIARWIAERPGVKPDEFIDDIPFPETQNYVKKILGTAEDYRRLYGGGVLVPAGLGSKAQDPVKAQGPGKAHASASTAKAKQSKPSPKPKPRKKRR